jgi:hypothetical protein
LRILWAVSALSLLPPFGVTASGQTGEIRGRAASVTVYTHFEQTRSESAFQTMKAEVAAIMEPIGLEFEWRSLDEPHENEVSAELIVVTFKGPCQVDEYVEQITGPAALGWTHISDGAVLPFTDIDCACIRTFIARLVAGARPRERERLLGRALGRVLAHEMYHILASTVHHGSTGVAKAAYTAAELVSEKFRFEETESRALKSGKVQSLIRAARKLPQPPALALASGQ